MPDSRMESPESPENPASDSMQLAAHVAEVVAELEASAPDATGTGQAG